MAKSLIAKGSVLPGTTNPQLKPLNRLSNIPPKYRGSDLRCCHNYITDTVSHVDVTADSYFSCHPTKGGVARKQIACCKLSLFAWHWWCRVMSIIFIVEKSSLSVFLWVFRIVRIWIRFLEKSDSRFTLDNYYCQWVCENHRSRVRNLWCSWESYESYLLPGKYELYIRPL